MSKIINHFLLYLRVPLTYASSIWLRIVRKKGIDRLSDEIFMKLGILPILDHYYEPLINPKKYITKSLRDDRDIIGIDFNLEEQLNLLERFNFNDELLKIPLKTKNKNEFYYDNPFYSSGDAEYLYSIIRHFKPNRIIEIGCGYSTLMIKNAICQNIFETLNYNCEHICIEPYEREWLEELDVSLVREKVEFLDKSYFQKLKSNDILFIDSSHIIRPQGDVLFEYLEILPSLASGVVIHIHDIFTPKDYPNEWVYRHRLWNEQYLLEAFLIFNSEFKIIGALNYLAHNHKEKLAKRCPIFGNNLGYEGLKNEPRAFWLQKK